MKTDWPQIYWIVVMSLALLLHAVKNGEKKDNKYNFNLLALITAWSAFVLYCGGFWT
jgi:hypothetical protein